MVANLSLDRGDRRTLRVSVSRDTDDPADPVQIAVANQWSTNDWVTVDPVDPDVTPAVYEVRVAFGDSGDFPTPNPAGTVTVTGTTAVWIRPAAGADIDVQQVAWIRVRA